jgi:hypothetical protein
MRTEDAGRGGAPDPRRNRAIGTFLFPERNGQVAEIDIRTLAVLRGNLPPRALALTVEWALQHKRDLLRQWNRARRQLPLQCIEPLP